MPITAVEIANVIIGWEQVQIIIIVMAAVVVVAVKRKERESIRTRSFVQLSSIYSRI